ncbi:MAG: efflux RND transporter permease subunit [Proteobacteria bacterium]|nr:efflux RND transporter permease subunit [Pseudomonadota bacterium]
MKGVNLSAWAVRHRTLVLFMILVIGLSGTLSYLRLGRAEDPSFTIKVGVITVAWPGATAVEMQSQVTERIEKKLQELAYFHKVVTYAKPGFAALQMEFKDYTPAKQVPELFYQLRKKLGDLKPELPAGVIGPNVNDEFGDVDSILMMITGDGADYAQMKRVAEDLKRAFLKIPEVVKVNLYGTQEERIHVEFSHAKLATLGIPASAIFDAIARQNTMTPAGTFETSAQRIPLRVTGALDGAAAVAAIPVEANGRSLRLGDIAEVTRGFKDPADFIIRQDGKSAIGLGAVMQKGANILSLGEHVDKTMEEFLKQLPVGIQIDRIANQPHVVEISIKEFVKSFLEALAIVLAVSFLSLGLRTGIVVAMSVPLVLAIVFTIMEIWGIDLHRISLGALIIALGLLVDDAIIAVEMMIVKMEEGWDRMKAAAFAWDSTAFPMLTGTLVTAAGFLPVGLAASGVGEYTGTLFIVVGLALIASWFVAVIFTPYLGVMLLPDFRKHAGAHEPATHGHAALYDGPWYSRLRSMVAWCVQRRGLVILMTIGIFALSIVAFGRVQQQFFPLSERPELFLEMRLPEGSSIGATKQVAQEAEALLKGDADVIHATAYIGQGSPRFWLGLNVALPNEAFAQIVILSKDVEARERIKARLDSRIAEGALSAARVRVDRFNFGPPVGFPVQFRAVGTDPAEVRKIAYQVRDVMLQNRKAVAPHLDWNEMMPSIRLVVDQDRARAFGLDPTAIAQTLQTLVSGVPVTSIRDGIEQVPVMVRAIGAERLDPSRLADFTLTARNGVPVPLTQVAKLVYDHEEPILWRRNRDMSITIRSDIIDGVQAPDVTGEIWKALEPVRASLPAGYKLEIGGAIEESDKANASIFKLFPLMFIIMLTLLMIQLQSFSKLFLVFLTAPLGLIGASLALNLSAKPFGFVALLGLIALAGMIMRNTVILVDQIDHDLDAGLPMREAIVEATVRRARPVILTALAAIMAMIPLAGSAFWGPMAYTIMGGLFVATFLTLLFLPALYAFWFRRKLRADDSRDSGAKPDTASPPAMALAHVAE